MHRFEHKRKIKKDKKTGATKEVWETTKIPHTPEEIKEKKADKKKRKEAAATQAKKKLIEDLIQGQMRKDAIAKLIAEKKLPDDYKDV